MCSETPLLRVDGNERLGPFRRIHGVNGGPKYKSGQMDLRDTFRAMAPSSTRLHDVSLLGGTEAVDVHCIFPLPHADPDDPANYTFAKTDDYLQKIRDIDSEIVFRLGEPIEHGPIKYHVDPPADPAKWARICANIVRHYNGGWADGFDWGIRYWEIWNEPNIHPCWTGTMEDYCELYRHAAPAVKAADPSAWVGGPALAGSIGHEPGRVFLQYVRDHDLPLDFVSWHNYASKPKGIVDAARSGLEAMREFGFENAESHLNEWNQFAGDFHRALREPHYRREMMGRIQQGEGAAFAVSALAGLATTTLDVANYYAAFPLCGLGMFDRHLIPGKNYHGLVAFANLLRSGDRIGIAGGNEETGLAVCASASAEDRTAAVILSNFADPAARVRVELSGLPVGPDTVMEQYLVDDDHELTLEASQRLDAAPKELDLPLPAHTVRDRKSVV